MDPNLFHLDWDRTFEVLAAVVVVAFFLERALSIVFEHRAFLERFDGKGVKEVIAYVAALGVCWRWHFDALGMVLNTRDLTSPIGYALTAAIVAGGSKASIALFQDVLGIGSTAQKQAAAKKRAATAAVASPAAAAGTAGGAP